MFDRRRVKCCLVGDYNVGKTSILYSFLDRPLNNIRSTTGIDFESKTLSILSTKIYLTIWDTAGSERFASLLHSYIRDAQIVIIVYDTSVRTSNLVKWLRYVEQHSPKVIGILGNKTDLTRDLREDIDDIISPWRRQSFKVVFDELSSRNPHDVKTFFKKCLRELLSEKETTDEFFYVKFETAKAKKRMCCT